MSDKRLYVVNVQLEFDMVVAAENEKDAEEVAFDHWKDDILNNGSEPYTSARLVRKTDRRWVETEYSGLDAIPFTNNLDQTTLEEYFQRMETDNVD